nr:MAG TPA: hypothetical protein [Caudoviricetes sp.]
MRIFFPTGKTGRRGGGRREVTITEKADDGGNDLGGEAE